MAKSVCCGDSDSLNFVSVFSLVVVDQTLWSLMCQLFLHDILVKLVQKILPSLVNGLNYQ